MSSIAPLSVTTRYPGTTSLPAPVEATRSASASTLGAASASASASASTTVSIAQATASGPSLYSSSGVSAPAKLIQGSGTPAWEHTPAGALDALLARNAATGSLAARWSGLGSALMTQAGQGNAYSQSLLSSAQALQSSDAVQAIQRLQLHDFAADSINLSLQTASGAQVDLTLSADANGVAVKFSLTQGSLSDDERAALVDLGDAFQDAIDGLAQQPPQLALDGLMQAQSGSSVFTSLDLHATLGGDDQHIDLHLDASKRELSTSGSSGSMKLAVNMSDARLMGNAQQRQRAVASYLSQFDDATRRGHGDAGLMSMFKQGFAQLNGASVQAPKSPAAGHAASLYTSVTDRGLLSGLSDFSASVTQKTTSPNPLNSRETDNFSYQVSQHTSINGARQADRKIDQRQQSSLHAAYHEALQSDLPLKLGTDRNSQNYTYHQIDDSATSSLRIGYQGGLLTQALLQQSASQDTTVSKYVLGQRVRVDNTPLTATIVHDLTTQLQGDTARTDASTDPAQPSWLQRLQRISALALLVSDPAQLRSRQGLLADA